MAVNETINLNVDSNFKEVNEEISKLKKSVVKSTDAVKSLGDASKSTEKSISSLGKKGSKSIKNVTKETINLDNSLKGIKSGVDVGVQSFSVFGDTLELFGTESEAVNHSMKKMQTVMGMTRSIKGMQQAGKGFVAFGKTAVTALKGIKGALMATGIGLLVVALGTIASYWEEISEWATGVSTEMDEQYETAVLTADLEAEKLENMGKQDNLLRLQGKTEREIVEMKIGQLQTAIEERKIALQTAYERAKAQIAASERQQKFMKKIMDFMNAPIKLLLWAVDQLFVAMGKSSTLADDFQKKMDKALEMGTAGKKEKILKEVLEQKELLDELLNDQAGYLLKVKAMDEAAGKQGAAAREKRAQNDRDFERALFDEKLEIQKEGYEKERAQTVEEYRRKREDLLLSEKYTADQKLQLLEALNQTEKSELIRLEIENAEAVRRIKNEADDLEISLIKDQTTREKEELRRKYEDILSEIEFNEELNETEKTRLRELYAQERDEALVVLELSSQQRALKDLATYNQARQLQEQNDFDALLLLKQEQALLLRDQALLDDDLTANERLLIEAQYQQTLRDLDDETTANNLENKAKIQEQINEGLSIAEDSFKLLSDFAEMNAKKERAVIDKKYKNKLKAAKGDEKQTRILEKQRIQELNKANKKAFKMKKASDLASATIDGYKSVLGAYAGTPGGPIIKTVAAVIAGIFSAMSIAKIANTKFEGESFDESVAASGSGGGGEGQAISPEFNIVGDSGLNQLEGLDQPPTQAYVVSADITTAQGLDRNRVENATI